MIPDRSSPIIEINKSKIPTNRDNKPTISNMVFCFSLTKDKTNNVKPRPPQNSE